ncbi:hypothetical protein V6N12_069019 [Hibiscus sabdariffa]|uniref:Uncharacterized protein n=1 Tax=Hibiscus sabdariffa TaxID=183260 RepID=A0ABR2FCM0_9ROSI
MKMWEDDLSCYEFVCNPSIKSISYHPPFGDINKINASSPLDLISLPTNQFVVAGSKRRFEYEKRLHRKASTKLLGALLTSQKKSQELNTFSQAEDLDSSSSNILFQAFYTSLNPWPNF